ncbi:hypothetical protein [uncultured Sneathiella sp.]|tara:strand:+ start:2137 stop:2277 length:141 start_codon:yes stop_codon:yes gene_type:complete
MVALKLPGLKLLCRAGFRWDWNGWLFRQNHHPTQNKTGSQGCRFEE